MLDEAGQAQHVLGHALAPLAAGFRAGERLAQALRRGGQRRGGLGVGRAAWPRPPRMDAAWCGARWRDEVADALQLVAHSALDLLEAGVDRLLPRRELALVRRLSPLPSCSRLSTATCWIAARTAASRSAAASARTAADAPRCIACWSSAAVAPEDIGGAGSGVRTRRGTVPAGRRAGASRRRR